MAIPGERGFKVKALGEVAIRCKDVTVMARFYEDIIGLERLDGDYSKQIVFFKIAEGFGGHTTVLALFDANLGGPPEGAPRTHTGQESSLHHLALTLSYEEQDAAIEWYKKNDINHQVELFGWVGWRGIFTHDPEGNTVELVAFDKSLLGNS